MRIFCCPFPTFPSCPRPNLRPVKAKILSLFKSAQYHLSDTFCTPITTTYWSLRSFSHKQAPSSSKANHPPKLTSLSGDDDFINFIDTYAENHFNKSKTMALKDLNKKIQKGTCFAQCALLANTLLNGANKKDLPTLVKELPHLRNELATLQAREWVRFADNITSSKETWLENHAEEEFNVTNKLQLTTTLTNALLQSKIIMVHCTDGRKTHVLLIETKDNGFSFFNPSSFGGGCFTYNDQSEGLNAFLSHLSSTSFFLKSGARWKLKKF